MRTMRTKLAKIAIAGGVAVTALGIGAGVASADPGHDDRGRSDQHQDPQRHDQQPPNQPTDHGFWLFNQWIPLP